MSDSAVRVSVVVPVLNERESVPRLLDEIRSALGIFEQGYEVVLIDDGSTDGTWQEIVALSTGYPELVGLRLTRNYGQTAALMAGIRASRGEIVVTMDGDLQNDPKDIPRLIERMEEGYEIVSGWRRRRHDALFSRRLPSRIANAITRKVTRVAIHDQGCALKAYRGDLLRSISLYSDFHRFVVPLTQMGGARVAEIETNHRARSYGRSKYGLARTFRVLADLATLLMITRFLDRLLPWFVSFAVPLFLLSLAVVIWTARVAIRTEEASLLVPIGSAILLLQASFAIVGAGLLAERIRLLALRGSQRGDRMLATVYDPAHGTARTFLVRNGRAARISQS